MRRFLAQTAVILVLISASAAVGNAANSLVLFATEQSAQQHCPSDVVVWLNLPTGIYHLKGQRWYGRTKRGAYVCKREADLNGDRETRNGE